MKMMTVLMGLGLCSSVWAGALPRTTCTLFGSDLSVYQGSGHVTLTRTTAKGTCSATVDPTPTAFDGPGTGIAYYCGRDFTFDWSESIDRHGKAVLICAVP